MLWKYYIWQNWHSIPPERLPFNKERNIGLKRHNQAKISKKSVFLFLLLKKNCELRIYQLSGIWRQNSRISYFRHACPKWKIGNFIFNRTILVNTQHKHFKNGHHMLILGSLNKNTFLASLYRFNQMYAHTVVILYASYFTKHRPVAVDSVDLQKVSI